MKKVRKNFKIILDATMRIGEIFRYIGIQKRLIGAFLLISIIPLVLMGFASYRNSKNAIQNKIVTYSVQLMDQLGNNINIELKKLDTISKDIINSAEAQNMYGYTDLDANARLLTEKPARNAILMKIQPIQGYVGLAEIVVSDGKGDLTIVGTGKNYYDKSTGNPARKQNNDILNNYIKASMDANGPVCMGFDDLTGLGKEIIFARLARSNSISGGDIGTLIFSISPDFLLNVYKDLNMGENAQTFIIDQDGLVLSSRVAAEIGSAFMEKSLIEEIKHDEAASKTRTFTLNVGGKQLLTSYSTLGETGWYVVSLVPYSYLDKESNNIRSNLILWGLICLLGALVLSYLVTGSISNPLNKIVKVMNEAKTGNLLVDIKDNRKDEIAVVSKSFKEMLSNIRLLVLSFRESADAVLQNSERIAASSRQFRGSSELTSNVIHQIAAGASEQAGDAGNCVEYMNRLSGDIDKMQDDASHISEQVIKTKKLSESTYSVINSLKEKAYETSSVSERIACDINSLNNDMKEIRNIIKFIVDISEQTNLLSLNASIEAARAGAAGLCFAVVADEVKKLANQSKEASVSISKIINNIQAKTDKIVKMTSDSGIIIGHQMDAVEKTYDAFKIIYNAMEDVTRSIDSTSQTTREVLSSRQKTLGAIGGISSVSEETAATAEEVAAGISESLKGIQDLADSSGELNEMASKLKKAIEKFKV